MVHYGHSNQLRQAKAMGDHLTVGVHTDGLNLLPYSRHLYDTLPTFTIVYSRQYDIITLWQFDRTQPRKYISKFSNWLECNQMSASGRKPFATLVSPLVPFIISIVLLLLQLRFPNIKVLRSSLRKNVIKWCVPSSGWMR